MMNTPTFKEQFDKITRAYFEDQLDPGNACACFVGNLLNGASDWVHGKGCDGLIIRSDRAFASVYKESKGFYSLQEIITLERNFMDICYSVFRGIPTEDSLFAAMDSTLDMLRKIHESKGEIIEDFEFTKRQLAIL